MEEEASKYERAISLLLTANPVSECIMKYLNSSDLARLVRVCSTSRAYLHRPMVYQLWQTLWPFEVDLYFELENFTVTTNGVYFANVKKLLLPSFAGKIFKKEVRIPYKLTKELSEGGAVVNYLDWELSTVGICASPLAEGEDVCLRLNYMYPIGTLFVMRVSLKPCTTTSIECECVKVHFIKGVKRFRFTDPVDPPFYYGDNFYDDTGDHIPYYRPQSSSFIYFSGFDGANIKCDEPQMVDQQSLEVLLNGPRIHYHRDKSEHTITITEKLYRKSYGFISGLIEAYSSYNNDIIVNPSNCFREYLSLSNLPPQAACKMFYDPEVYNSFICKELANKPDNVLFSIRMYFRN